MANSSSSGDDLQKISGNTGTDVGGDPGDQAFIMNRKVARLAGSPVALVDRDFQRLQRQAPRSNQNRPTQSVSGIIMSAAKGKGRKKSF